MADLKSADSEYDTGTSSTHTDLVNNVDNADADHINHVASGVIAIESILGSGTDLKGTAADLAVRLAIPLETSGKLKDFSATNKTTFPISVAEGGTNAVAFTASQILRRNASTQTVESSGYTVPGASGVMVSEADTQTLTNKTLTTPTISTPTLSGTLTNWQHDHSDAANGGLVGVGGIADAGIAQAKLKTTTVSLAGTLSPGSRVDIALTAYAFFPMIHVDGTTSDIRAHTTDGASADAPRFSLFDASTANTYDVDYRYIQA